MMLKERTNGWARLKLLLFVPVMAGTLYAFARPEVKETFVQTVPGLHQKQAMDYQTLSKLLRNEEEAYNLRKFGKKVAPTTPENRMNQLLMNARNVMLFDGDYVLKENLKDKVKEKLLYKQRREKEKSGRKDEQIVGFWCDRGTNVDEIKAIHQAIPDREIEVFVHGALCVSYSGVCYASEKCFGRSANRGECAQFCRMKFDLLDSNGQEIEHQRYLLSLKDLCQLDHLKDLADAGATSFKIEGRLKDINYVKNVVAAYSRQLDAIVKAEPRKYRRASVGHVQYNFTPNLKKTFNRGFTHYFLNGRQPDIASFDTPKAIGEFVGKVKEIRGNISFNVATVASFKNGDGLCFINDDRELEGFRVNRVEGNRLYPFGMPEHLRPGMALYRNNDRAFENLLARKSAERKIYIVIAMEPVMGNEFREEPQGVKAVVNIMKTIEADGGLIYQVAEVFKELKLEKAKRPQGENIKAQMSKLGDTIYEAYQVELLKGMETYFVPNSILTAIRRELIDELTKANQKQLDKSLWGGWDRTLFNNGFGFSQPGEHRLTKEEFTWQPEYGKWGYLYNIANYDARDFYQIHGLSPVVPAFELGKNIPSAWDAKTQEEYDENIEKDKANRSMQPKYTNEKGESLLMQCRHCIRYSLGYCVKRGGKKPSWREPLFLQLGDGRRFRLEFACNECQMNLYSEK